MPEVTQERPPIPKQIWVLVGAAFAIALGFGLITPVLPAYARSFDVGVAAASVVVSAFAFFRLVFAPAGGSLVSRLGERPVYLAGLVIVALSSFATAVAQSYTELLIYRGLGGLGSTMFTVSAMSLLVRLSPPAIRGRVASAYGSAFLVGGMIGPVLGGFLAELGYRVPFVLYGVAILAAAAMVAWFLRGARLRPAAKGDEAPPMPFREAVGSSTYRAALASGFANGWANFGVRVAILPQFAVAVHDATWVAGAALAVSAVGTAGALQVASRYTDSWGRRPMVLVGLAVTAVGLGSSASARTSSCSSRSAPSRVSAPAWSTRRSRPPSPTSSGRTAPEARCSRPSRCSRTAGRSSGRCSSESSPTSLAGSRHSP